MELQSHSKGKMFKRLETLAEEPWPSRSGVVLCAGNPFT